MLIDKSDSLNQLKKINELVIKCKKCNLSSSRKNAVPGVGPSYATLMFVGEAPGSKEDEVGLPFIGRAGNLLEKLFIEVPIYREDVFITNVIKCRPPNNRNPLENEILACKNYLMKQIEIINPRIIVTLGKYALLHFIPNGKISLDHGRNIPWKNRILYPIYHPAAALYNPKILETLKLDMSRIPELLRSTLSKKN